MKSWRRPCGLARAAPAGAGGAAVYVQARAHQVDGEGVPAVGNGEGITTNGFGPDAFDGAEAEFLEEGLEPEVEGFGLKGVVLGALLPSGVKPAARGRSAAPKSARRLR